jgi:hypothetical protein
MIFISGFLSLSTVTVGGFGIASHATNEVSAH